MIVRLVINERVLISFDIQLSQGAEPLSKASAIVASLKMIAIISAPKILYLQFLKN